MELRAPHVDSKDRCCAALEQAIGEAASGCPEIHATKAGDIDGECIERTFELVAATAHVAFGFDEFDGGTGIDHRGRFDERECANARPAGHDQPAGALTRFGETTLDEQNIGTNTGHA